jgi:hypothetical protein
VARSQTAGAAHQSHHDGNPALTDAARRRPLNAGTPSPRRPHDGHGFSTPRRRDGGTGWCDEIIRPGGYPLPQAGFWSCAENADYQPVFDGERKNDVV